jgi:hypothetical protein
VTYWIVQLPNGQECWLWDQSAAVEGDVADLPQRAAPATPTPPAPLGVILVTVVGPKPDGDNAALISGATVELGVAAANGDFIPTGERAEELQEAGHYRFLNVSSGEKLVQATSLPDYRSGKSPVTVLIGGEPSQVEIRVDWTDYRWVNCSNLSTIFQRLKCYNQLIAVPPGGGVYYDPGSNVTPTP